jgi:transposase InsO family protein
MNGHEIETASGERHPVQGTVNLPMTLEGRTKNLPVLVVPTLQQSIILGIDFWDAMNIVTDIHGRTWEFSNKTATIYSLTEGIKSKNSLSEEQEDRLNAIIEKHFPKTEEQKIGRTNLVMHVIDTGDAKPIKQRYYTMSPARQKLVEEELDKMLKLNIVEPSKSPWSSPIVLLDKPDGSKRFCINFKALNAVSKPDAYPLPKVTHILDRLRDARYLTSLDIKSAYWQIPLDPLSKEKTAFTVPGRGLFHFNVMPFGLHNAPATWQRFIDNVLGPELEVHVFVYLDDIVIVTAEFEKHLEVLDAVLRRLNEAKVTLNLAKCNFCRPQLKYLGYVVDSQGLRVDPEKVESVLKIPAPKNSKEVRQFVGTASWYRRFIPDFSTRLYPLTKMLKKGKRFIWTEEAQKAFEDIRSCLIKSPILTCPNFDKPFTISCDASGVGLGAILSQESEKGEAVVAYASRTLTRSEQKYSATERECLAVIWAIEKFRPYIEGTRFTVVTDHYSLLWLLKLKDPQGRLARWTLRLQPYDFNLVHRKGKENVVPDMLSRLPENKPEETQIIDTMYQIEVGTEDKWYHKMVKMVEETPERYPLWRVENGKLWKLLFDKNDSTGEENGWKEVVSKERRNIILAQFHDAKTAGHLGIYKTFKRIQQLYYWPKMRQDIAKYVRCCDVCQRTKYDQEKPAGYLGARRSADQPWVMLSADCMGPFPRSSRGFKFLLVVTDTFTKFTLLFPLRAATSSNVARHLINDVFMVYGVPKYLICDNGSEFIGPSVKRVAEEYQVKILLNASRHPQANPTERTNKTIIGMIRAYITDNHRVWDENIPQLGFALRTAVNESTGFTPAYLTFGRELNATGTGFNLLKDQDTLPENTDRTTHAGNLKNLVKLYRQVKTNLEKAHQKNEKHYNLRRRELSFDIGQYVLKRNFTQSNASRFYSSKLAPQYVGPYRIKHKVSPVVYQLEDANGKSIGNWHVKDLKPYYLL